MDDAPSEDPAGTAQSLARILNEALATLNESAPMTVRGLCRSAQIGPTTWYRIAAGDHTPSDTIVQRLAVVLGLDPGPLVELAREQRHAPPPPTPGPGAGR